MMDISQKKFDPERLKKAHRLMEWSNIIVIACSALSITAWFTAHFVLFYILGSFALVLSLIFAWGPVFLGLSGPGEGRIVNGILFIVIGILVTHKFWAGLILGGCFFGLFNMAPLAVDLYKMRRDKKNKEGSDVCEEPAHVMEEGRDERINQMSAAFNSLSAVTATLTDGAEELKSLAPDVDLLKDYISSGQWLKDFEADERGEIGTDVDRSVLSEDGLYNLMEDLDDLMHTFEELQDKFAADPDLELKLQD